MRNLLRYLCLILICYQFTALADKPGLSLPDQNQVLDYAELRRVNQGQPIWFHENKLNLSGISLLSLLADLGFRELAELSPDERENREVTDQVLTQQLYRIAILFDGYQITPKEDPIKDIMVAAGNHELANYIDSLLPQFEQVVQLRKAIVRFRQKSKTAWPVLDKSFTPKLGQGHKQIGILKDMLFRLGDLKRANINDIRWRIFDIEVENAIKRFQQRHGLEPTGSLDNSTRAALNKAPSERLAVLQHNLWRWLSLPSIPPERYVLVNIPAFQLNFVEQGVNTLDMRVIVGQAHNPTPVMVTEIDRVTLNPSWKPTRNIIHNELLPQYRADPSSLRRQNFKLVKGSVNKGEVREIDDSIASVSGMLREYRLVQFPGKDNALGKYRFNIKNYHSVYLHDTPVKSLFRKPYRALSHGCIRLQKPALLARHILKGQNTDEQHLLSVSKVQTRHIKLTTTVPVFVTYQSAWVNESGEVNWRNDIYQLDDKAPPASSSYARIGAY